MKRDLPLLLLLVGMMTSCRSSLLLKSDFESQTIGSLPEKNIPGEPSGDSILYTREQQPRIRVVASSSASEKALEFNTASAPGLTAHNQWLSFKGVRTNLTQPIYFYYTRIQTGTFDRLMVDIDDGSATTMARMHIERSGRVILVTSFPSGETYEVGTIPPGTMHTIIFTVNVRAGKYNLTIIKSGGNLTATDRPLINSDLLSYANPARPSIHFRYSDTEFSGNKYVLENVYISKKRP
ncbi:hypothetical protein [Telluribacter humicola]|uniref:hypothetical protein n=1 Tax=Telluribacter humicola TaxID=1720261 RepID=UPI001A95DD55|nr:hypothetical protein [Telluribacter humicola]